MATTCCVSKPVIRTPAAGGGQKVPRFPVAASGSSGRRFCRIYREGDQWILHLQPGAWPSNSADKDCRVPFHSLSEAIGYAVGNDLSYRVIHDREAHTAAEPSMLDLSHGNCALSLEPVSHPEHSPRMADDPTKKAADRKRIDVSEDYECRYWAERFGVSPERLKRVVAQVGVMVEDVERELRRT